MSLLNGEDCIGGLFCKVFICDPFIGALLHYASLNGTMFDDVPFKWAVLGGARLADSPLKCGRFDYAPFEGPPFHCGPVAAGFGEIAEIFPEFAVECAENAPEMVESP